MSGSVKVTELMQLFEHDVAALEQRVHRVADDIDRPVAFREVGNVDEVDGLALRLVGEQRDQARRALDRVEGDALQRQRVVRAVHVGRQVGFGVEHVALAGFEPVGIDVQFLNQYVAVARRKPRLAGFDHRQRRFADSKSLCQLLLCHAELLAYQFYPFVHRFVIGIIYIKYLNFIAENSNFELIFVLQS